MNCQACNNLLTADDLAVDPYTKLCRGCWALWEIEAGAPLKRYPTPGTVCVACGMGFGGTEGFDQHRHQGRCRSPAELKAKNRPLIVKAGIWVRELSQDAFSASTGEPRSDSTEKVIPPYHPDDEDALNRVPGWESA